MHLKLANFSWNSFCFKRNGSNKQCCLTADNDSLPTMKILQGGLLNDDSCLDEFMSFVSHLVRFVLEDPGMSNPKEV